MACYTTCMNILLPLLAFAQTTTATSSGQPVPTTLATSSAGASLGIIALIIPIVIVVIAIIALVFWVKMLIHAIKNPIDHKPLWIIILLAFGIIGAIVYYFAVKKNASTASATPSTPSN